jgi:putative endonuclease
MAQHNELGRLGEKKVLDFLSAKGYQILDVNWRFEKCELDLVCAYQNLIVFVEVKTRSSSDFGKPAEFVTQAKQSKLIEGAEAYLEINNLEKEIRFDIAEVLVAGTNFSINYIEDAFKDGM